MGSSLLFVKVLRSRWCCVVEGEAEACNLECTNRGPIVQNSQLLYIRPYFVDIFATSSRMYSMSGFLWFSLHISTTSNCSSRGILYSGHVFEWGQPKMPCKRSRKIVRRAPRYINCQGGLLPSTSNSKDIHTFYIVNTLCVNLETLRANLVTHGLSVSYLSPSFPVRYARSRSFP